jgi:DNA-binding GntR family transcriptional regulator
MSGGSKGGALQPLGEALQLGHRAYDALLARIVSGEIALGAPLRVDAIARQLAISTTPVREALSRLEKDALVEKVPYQGWFVRTFEDEEVRELYELRAGMECFGVRLACERITSDELARLRQHQRTGEAALGSGDLTAYWAYNRDFHAAVLRAARNGVLLSLMSQFTLQVQIITAHTVRFRGRPRKGFQEHERLVARLEARDVKGAQALMEQHILSALEDLLQQRRDMSLPAPAER